MAQAHPKVSALVAAYNAERWLPRCLESLRGQTLREVEIIAIDDCSTDGTLALLRRYAGADSRIVVVARKENGGIAKARNSGLRVATGDYVCMVDADDELSPDALQMAVERMESVAGTDCVLFRCDYAWPDGRVETFPLPSFDTISGREAFRLSLDWTIHGLYIVRREIHLRLPYDETSRYYSDENTTRMHYLASRLVAQCQGTYIYYQHSQSATHADSAHRLDTLEAHASLRRQIIAAGETGAAREYERLRWLGIVDAYWYYHDHRHQLDRKQSLARLRKAWQSIDRKAIPWRLKIKFGYSPMPCFALFRLEEWAYFSLRRWKAIVLRGQ